MTLYNIYGNSLLQNAMLIGVFFLEITHSRVAWVNIIYQILK